MVDAAPTSRSLRLVFFGTPAFAVPGLERLIESRHTVVGVVTQPDRPRGRGQRSSPGAVKLAAGRHGLPLEQPDDPSSPAFLERLRSWRPDLGVVVAYGHLLAEEILQAPRLGMINVHASLLPRYRGAAPIHRAILAGDTVTGVSIMRIVRALDAGPVLDQASHPIAPDQTSDALEVELADLGAGRLREVVDRLADGPVPETPQDDSEATYAPRLRKREGTIDWHRPAPRIHDQVRGLFPWPHAFTYLDGRRYIVWRTRVASLPAGDRATRAAAGTILQASGGQLLVKAGGQTALDLLRLQVEGRKPLETPDFLAGHPLPRDAVFETVSPPAAADRV